MIKKLKFGILTADNYVVLLLDIQVQFIVSGSMDNTIKMWDLKTGELLQTLTGHTQRINSVAISPDRWTIASGSDDQTIKIWGLFI